MTAPLTDREKAWFDAIKQVATSARPNDLALWRMTLDGEPVAVIVQRVISSTDGTTVGWQPLARILDDEDGARLQNVAGEGPQEVPPDDLEGAA